MLLAIDIGNTNIVLGVFEGDRLIQSWRLSTNRQRTADELGIWVCQLFEHRRLDVGAVDGVILASVVPQLTGTTIEMASRYFGREPLVVEGGIRDRDAGAVRRAVRRRRRPDRQRRRRVRAVRPAGRQGRSSWSTSGPPRPSTRSRVAGEYLGGVICPGVQISADALFQRAARLPRVDVRRPARVIGRSTVGSMQSGLFYGYVGLVEGLVRRMRAELGSPAICIATGGLAELIAPETAVIEAVDRDLTLHGLRIDLGAEPAACDAAGLP